MRSDHKFKLIVIFVVFLLTLLYTFPSTPWWESSFGLLTRDEQVAVPFAQLVYKDGDDGNSGIIEFAVVHGASIFTKNSSLRPEDVLTSVADTSRRRLMDLGYEAKIVNPDYSKGTLAIRVAKKEQKIGKADLPKIMAQTNLYASLPLGLSYIFPQSKITLGLDLKGGIDLVYQVDLSSVSKDDNPADAVKRSVEIIRNRIDIYGVAEPQIKEQEGHRIRIQLPGVRDIERVKGLIQSTAMLKFHIVLNAGASVAELEPVNPETEMVLISAAQRSAQGELGAAQGLYYKLKREPEVTGRDLKYAQEGFDDMGGPMVHLAFNPEGAIKFSKATGQHLGEKLAIVLDNKVHSAPEIQSKITGGLAQITGRFSLDEAKNLAIVLRAGALPANLNLIESRVVGPTLGAESIRAGWQAGLVGAFLVVVFMITYYKAAGVMADLAVLFNILITFSALVFFGGTLTLPGIAGLVLSVGMAVDANIIIFERIREELRSGKTVRASIESGFDRALTCVIDSNVTTILTVIVLYVFGSGPIRGFATTLGIGLVANIFTAIICVKLAMDLFYGRAKSVEMSI